MLYYNCLKYGSYRHIKTINFKTVCKLSYYAATTNGIHVKKEISKHLFIVIAMNYIKQAAELMVTHIEIE